MQYCHINSIVAFMRVTLTGRRTEIMQDYYNATLVSSIVMISLERSLCLLILIIQKRKNLLKRISETKSKPTIRNQNLPDVRYGISKFPGMDHDTQETLLLKLKKAKDQHDTQLLKTTLTECHENGMDQGEIKQ
jgi:hypothetical protein